jgi:hypothetical protein
MLFSRLVVQVFRVNQILPLFASLTIEGSKRIKMLFCRTRTALLPFRASKSKSTTRIAPNPPPPPQTAPICGLPVELLQEITSYLELASTAAFSLSSRYIYYAVGTAHLSTYLQTGSSGHIQPSKIQRRKNIEILERAFPSHWYCAWCDIFHAQDKEGGPKSPAKEKKRLCAKYNSYLHAGKDDKYVLSYHHVRLVVNNALWGAEYGIPLDALHYHNQGGWTKVLRTQVPTAMWCEGRIRGGRLILHATFKIWLPESVTKYKSWLSAMWPALPQIVVGHRDSHEGHTGLKTTLARGNLFGHVQLCSMCATDYYIMRQNVKTSTGESQVCITIDTHRDLGDGRSPFDASWRAHGELGDGALGFGGDVVRLTDFRAGDIKKMFEAELPLRSDDKDDAVTKALSELHRRHKRSESSFSGTLSLTDENIESRSARVRASASTRVREDEEGRNRDANRRRDREEVARLSGTHRQIVRQNNVRIKAEGPRFTPPWGMGWDVFVDHGGMRGSDGIPLTDDERRQLTSGRGLFGG